MNQLSEHQLLAGQQVITRFSAQTNQRWVILTAQMQSGKTGTYYFVAAEMLRLNKVDNVVIFSGNTELELKKQTVDYLYPFLNAGYYRKYLFDNQTNLGLSFDEIEYVLGKVATHIQVIWGSELKKRSYPMKNTLFVWDESHCAQHKQMQPNMMLKKANIYGNGNIYLDSGNYMLSVSATPFSEISDVLHLGQKKSIIRLLVDDGYHGLGSMLAKESLVKYHSDEWKITLENALRSQNQPNKCYAIVRVMSNTKTQDAMCIATRLDWKIETYNSSPESTVGHDLNKLLDVLPTQNTVIFIKGMCRMGKVICKKHISFCMETALNSKTDVVLQGLLGRLCGYHQYTSTKLFLPNKIMESDEFVRYIQYLSISVNMPDMRLIMMPRHGNNLSGGRLPKNDHLYPTIPIKILAKSFVVYGSIDIEPSKDNTEYLIESIRALVYSSLERGEKGEKGVILNYNIDKVYEQIKMQLENPEFTTKVHIIGKDSNGEIKPSLKAYLPAKLAHLFETKSTEQIKEEIVWFSTDFPKENIRKGDVFINLKTLVSQLTSVQINPQNIVTTNKKEAFCDTFWTNIDNHNYYDPLKLPPYVYFDEDLLLADLIAQIIMVNNNNKEQQEKKEEQQEKYSECIHYCGPFMVSTELMLNRGKIIQTLKKQFTIKPIVQKKKR